MEEREVNSEIAESKPRDVEFKKSPEPTAKQDELFKLIDKSEDMSAAEIVSSMKVIQPTLVSDVMTSIPAWLGDEAAMQRYDKARLASRTAITDAAKRDFNLDLDWSGGDVGEETWFVNTPEGKVEVTPGFWEDFKKADNETLFGIGAGFTGYKLGFAATPPVLPFVGPLAKPLGGLIGAATFSWLGATAGNNMDYLEEALKLQQDMEAEAMAYRSLNATELAAIGEIIGYPLAKGLGMGWRGIVKAKSYITGGESGRAYDSLKETLFLTDEQLDEMVKQFEKHVTLEGSQKEKAIQATALTEPGMQTLVSAAAETNPKVPAAVNTVISDRADQIIKEIDNAADSETPRVLTEDLNNYVSDVKEQYNTVKAKAYTAPRADDFTFDFEEIAITPVMDKLVTKITDQATKERFINQMSKVNAMSETRTLGDLIDLRQMVNDFLYNKKIVGYDTKDTLREVLNNIDSSIEDGANFVFRDPKGWMSEWADARAQYSKMKQVEKTAMYRAFFKADGTQRAITPEQAVKALGKHMTTLDGSFEQVITKLPIESRKKVETAMLDSLANKYFVTTDNGSRAMHFTGLAEDLEQVSFTTPDARALKAAMIDLSETFRNDAYLAGISSNITPQKFQSFLTIDPVARMQYEAASGFFNYAKSKIPSVKGRQTALVKQAAKLLENPLNVKTIKEVTESVYDDANLSKQIRELTQEAARNRNATLEGSPKVYVDATGKIVKDSKMYVPAHRILTLQQAKEIADREFLTLESKSLDAVLKKYGYKAVLQGSDRIRFLGDK